MHEQQLKRMRSSAERLASSKGARRDSSGAGRIPFSLLVSAVFLLSACDAEGLYHLRLLPPSIANAPRSVEIVRGIPFAQREDRTLFFDLYRAAEASEPVPLIVVIPGNSWRSAPREQLLEFAYDFAAQGYAAAAIDYRGVDDGVIFPEPLADVLAAIRHFKADAVSLGIDPDRLAAFGASAGAHLALMAGMADDPTVFNPDWPTGGATGIRAVVNLFGPTNLAAALTEQGTDYQLRTLERFLGGPPQEAEAAYHAASPIEYVRPDGPAVLTIHGDADEVVPVSQARQLAAALAGVGQPGVYLEIPGLPHAIGVIWLLPPAQDFRPTIFSFLADYL